MVTTLTTKQVQRYEAALNSGYMMTPADEDDVLTNQWANIAESERFPLVCLTPVEGGLVVRFIMSQKGDRLGFTVKKAQRLARRYSDGVLGARVGDVDSDADTRDFIAGPYPPATAALLARELARLTGQRFPLPDKWRVAS